MRDPACLADAPHAANGKAYDALQGCQVAVPARVADRPDAELLRWHNENVFERRAASYGRRLHSRVDTRGSGRSSAGPSASSPPKRTSFGAATKRAPAGTRCTGSSPRWASPARSSSCAYVVRRTGLWKLAGFASFSHDCKERLSLSGRAVEQRAAFEEHLWRSPPLRAARDAGVPYEKLRVLARLPDRELEAWLPRAQVLTCVALRQEVDDRQDAQMRAAKVLRGLVPARVAELLLAAFRAVREVEGKLLDDGKCLVLVAKHFSDTWREHVKRSRTRSQQVRDRDLDRCQAPGCSRSATHAHHVVPRSRGGGDETSNLVAVCGCHHLRGIHGGYMNVRGRAPDGLAWTLVGQSMGWQARQSGFTAAS